MNNGSFTWTRGMVIYLLALVGFGVLIEPDAGRDYLRVALIATVALLFFWNISILLRHPADQGKRFPTNVIVAMTYTCQGGMIVTAVEVWKRAGDHLSIYTLILLSLLVSSAYFLYRLERAYDR